MPSGAAEFLESVAAVERLSPAEAEHSLPVRLEGVVTGGRKEWGGCFLQEGSSGLFVDLGTVAEFPEVGSRIRVEGITGPGSYRPVVRATAVRVLGAGEMPSGISVSLDELWTGDRDGDRVRVRGYLVRFRRGAGRTELFLSHPKGEVTTTVLGPMPAVGTNWVHGLVEVVGVMSPVVGPDRRLLGVALEVSAGADVALQKTGEQVLADLSVQEVGSYLKSLGGDGKAQRLRGVVLFERERTLWIGDDRGVLSATTLQASAAGVGEAVEVVGYGRQVGGRPSLVSAQVVSRAPGRLPEAKPGDVAALTRPESVGRRLRVAGSLVHRVTHPTGEAWVMAGDDGVWEARLASRRRASSTNAWPMPKRGTPLELEGVVGWDTESVSSNEPARLYVGRPEDVRVTGAPPWTPEERARVVTVLLVVSGLGLAVAGVALVRVRRSNAELRRAEDALRRLNTELEGRVAIRTRELEQANQSLAEDIERRQAAEERLQESERWYRAVFDGVGEGIWVVETRRQLVRFGNAAARRMFALESEKVLGKPFWELHPAGERGRLEEAMETLRRGEACRLELTCRRHDGREFPARISAVVLEVDGIQLAVAFYQDLTMERRAEEARARLEDQVRQSTKLEAIGTLAGGIAHDFNNILGAMMGNIDLIRLDADRVPGLETPLSSMERAVERARDLVRRILAFSRQQEQRMRVTSVGAVLQETLGLMRPALPPSIELTLSVAPNTPDVRIDPGQIQQAVTNLISNASHAIGSRIGRIAVEAGPCLVDEATARSCHGLVVGPWLRIVVRDDGCGIPAAVRDRVFEPYFTTKPPGQGTGLGLSIVHGVVRTHGGAVALDSEPGRGTTIRIYLPLAAQEDAPVEASETVPPPLQHGRGEHVIFVDDEPSILEPSAKLLKLLGYRVSLHRDPVEALAAFRIDPASYGVAILDLSMPGMDGFQLGAAMLGLRADLPVILTTGMSAGVEREEVLARGFRQVLIKPFSAATLAVSVRECLDGAPTRGGRANAAEQRMQDAGQLA